MVSSVAGLGLRILGWQLAGIGLVALPIWWFDSQLALSIGVGGSIGFAAALYLVFVQVKHALQPARPASLLSLLTNWFIKTLLVLGLLMIALRSGYFRPLAVLLGLMMSLVLYWLAVVTQQTSARRE
jgi:hypothetical protein